MGRAAASRVDRASSSIPRTARSCGARRTAARAAPRARPACRSTKDCACRPDTCYPRPSDSTAARLAQPQQVHLGQVLLAHDGCDDLHVAVVNLELLAGRRDAHDLCRSRRQLLRHRLARAAQEDRRQPRAELVEPLVAEHFCLFRRRRGGAPGTGTRGPSLRSSMNSTTEYSSSSRFSSKVLDSTSANRERSRLIVSLVLASQFLIRADPRRERSDPTARFDRAQVAQHPERGLAS